MNRLASILPVEQVLVGVDATSKKRAFEEAGLLFENLHGLSRALVTDSLFARERLGSTGLGHGVAIPHGKLAKVKSIFGVFARLERPVDFEALDGAPVDLVFLLVAPESSGADHLKALACAARMLRDPGLVATIRATRDHDALYSLIAQRSKPHAA